MKPTIDAEPSPILAVAPLGFQWQTRDPFLFCVHHNDHYPAGNSSFGPAASRAGRQLGRDFAGIDGWRMYHGDQVPGFPRHPHRGFETVTIVRRGLLDHADSLGGAARYGGGDVQWMTAGAGIQHAEMFPLLDRDGPNPLELFQIWLNLPSRSKMVQPYFSLLWRDQLGRVSLRETDGPACEITVIAGSVGATSAPKPPPDSWAASPDSHVAIWLIKMPAGAKVTLPAGAAGLNRTLYAFEGTSLRIASRTIARYHEVQVRSDADLRIENGSSAAELLMLQGRPIGEPVVQHGPFVMNSEAEIQQAFVDYQRTRFGPWPWPSAEPVHGETPQRFAQHPDGRREDPT